jgi:hypothetical protein
VGIGTLSRQFPNRDALIEAVYRTETQNLAEAAPRLLEALQPVEALPPGCGCSSTTSPRSR